MRSVLIHSIVRCVAIAMAISLIGCTSRYRLELDIVESGERRRVQVEETQYARRAVLDDPFSDFQIRPGDGNCVIATTGARVRTKDGSGKYDVLTYDERFVYRLFLQLPAKLTPGQLPIAENSFVQILGRYELSAAERIFTQATGSLAVDSLAHNRAFISIDGRFLNESGGALEVKGEFKVKVK